jgi:hypothetical protein
MQTEKHADAPTTETAIVRPSSRIGTLAACDCGCGETFVVPKGNPHKRFLNTHHAKDWQTAHLAATRGKANAQRRQNITEALAGMDDVEKVRYGYQRGFAKARWQYNYRHFLRHLRLFLGTATAGKKRGTHGPN